MNPDELEKKSLKDLRTKGFAKLKSGCIHLRCPICGRKQSNSPRQEYDPTNAFLFEIPCDKHLGLKPTGIYFDLLGQAIEEEP